jgi:hypothetical protein
MRASEIYALHVEEERYHQAHDYLERARRALPPGSPARAALDALAAEVAGEWRAAREALVRLHQLGDAGYDQHAPTCIVPATPASPAASPPSPRPAPPPIPPTEPISAIL